MWSIWAGGRRHEVGSVALEGVGEELNSNKCMRDAYLGGGRPEPQFLDSPLQGGQADAQRHLHRIRMDFTEIFDAGVDIFR